MRQNKKTEDTSAKLPTSSRMISYTEAPFITIRLTQNSDRPYEAHAHPTLSIGFMLEGETLFHTPEGEFRLAHGSLAIIEPHLQHTCNPLPKQSRSYVMVYIDAALCTTLQAKHFNNKTLLPLRAPLVFHKELYETFTRIILSLLETYTPLHVKNFLAWLEAFLELYSFDAPAPKTPISLQKVAYFLENRLDEPISLSDLAKRFGFNTFSLIRYFKKAYGCTPKHYWLDARIHHAKTLLHEGVSLSLCALYCGFVDQSHFHRFFKRKTALTPKEYQQSFNNPLSQEAKT